MSHLYFNEESDHFEENPCVNEVFRFTILHHRKKLNMLTLHLPIYNCSIRIGISMMQIPTLLKQSERNRLPCCREVNAMLNASAKSPEREGNILAFSFYEDLLPPVPTVSPAL